MIKPTILKIFITVFLIGIIYTSADAQNKDKEVNYTKKPYWIEMIKDPNVNYFEANKAYDEFWAKRKKPKEEDEIIGQDKSAKEKQNFLQRWFKSKEEREEEEVRKYALEVKKFEHWKLVVKPYVQEDGRILNADEKLKLWEQQRSN